MDKNLAVITGCDSGIGLSLGKHLLENGFTVAAAYLQADPAAALLQNSGSLSHKAQENLYTCQMDIKIEKDIGSFAAFVRGLLKKNYRFDCLVNNAGIARGGPVEDLPLDLYRENFEVNFFGLVALTQKLIPYLIRSKGKIIMIGSMAGRIALPFLSPYASVKFALEGFSDSLRRELLPTGIKTVLIEPGGIATPIWNKSKKQDTSFASQKYLKSLRLFTEKFIEAGNRGMDVDKAAYQIYKIIKKKNPRDRYIVAKNKFMTRLPLILPRRFIDKLVIKNFEMDYGDFKKSAH